MPAEKAPKLVGITVKKSDDFSEWYNQVVLKAELADYAPIHGFMIIRPHGMQLWEGIQSFFDARIQSLGVQNAYFPLLIPESFFTKEKEHAEGFSPEVAWIAQDENSKAEERLAIRPTSETMMYDMYSKWIRSHRDLPLKINQWCNVVRWEIKATKLFLRTREFLWQEGHCAYSTHEEEKADTLKYLHEYAHLARELLAIPVIEGRKTKAERFAGADDTFTIEGFMPDGKALQMGTSHDLGQNFARVFNIRFSGDDEKEHTPYQNSWGISTRLIGAVIMAHGDDKGMVIPPRLARSKIVIVPILFDATRVAVLDAAKKMEKDLRLFGAWTDSRENYSAGWKFNEWEMKGIPLRIELGPRDVASQQCVLVRRDTGEKKTVSLHEIHRVVETELEAMHQAMLQKQEKWVKDQTLTVKTMKEFEKALDERKLIRALFCGAPACEKELKEKTTATSRCIPLDEKPVKGGLCVHCGSAAEYHTLFSKAY